MEVSEMQKLQEEETDANFQWEKLNQKQRQRMADTAVLGPQNGHPRSLLMKWWQDNWFVKAALVLEDHLFSKLCLPLKAALF